MQIREIVWVNGIKTVVEREQSLEEVSLQTEVAKVSIRSERNKLLLESDWTQVSDAPVDKVAWATYRQELRDITNQVGFPTDIIWPLKPE